jgi:hypothetical protein
MPMRWKISESSLTSAMFRSRWVFSITLAASATLIEAGAVHPGRDHAAVDLGHLVQRGRGVARDHLGDLGQRVHLVGRVDALGRVADEEVALPLQAGVLLQQRNAHLLGGPG